MRFALMENRLLIPPLPTLRHPYTRRAVTVLWIGSGVANSLICQSAGNPWRAVGH